VEFAECLHFIRGDFSAFTRAAKCVYCVAMTHGTGGDTDGARATIDGIAGGVGELLERLSGGGKISSRELRAIWGGRIRPFWRLHIGLYRALARRFLEQGDNYLASEAADEGGLFFGDDAALILIRALATARSGAPQAAQALLERKERVLADAEEAKSLLARTFKDLWKSSGEERFLRRAFELYHLDFSTTKGDRTFPGVNAASMAFFLGRTAEARRIASEVLGLLSGGSGSPGYWDRVSAAECLLVVGEVDRAREAYARAGGMDGIAHAHLATTRAQARLLLARLGLEASGFDACFPLPGVIAFTGHRADSPGRPTPRLPEEMMSGVKEKIRDAIRRSGAGFGYSAAASGADILFLECMQEAGLETYVHLPLPEEEFLRASVPDAGAWIDRYRAVTARATGFSCAARSGGLAFDYGNRLLLGAASRRARELGSEVRVLAVWDGLPAVPGGGGTGDYVRLARELGFAVEVIGLPAASAPPAAEGSDAPDERLLAVLTLSLGACEDAERGLAALAAPSGGTGAVCREVSGGVIRLFYSTPGEAAAAARRILSAFGRTIVGSIGLHAGPVRVGPHPVTGTTVARGEHASKSDDLAALSPAGLIYASEAFAALLGLGAHHDSTAEFLGFRKLGEAGAREPVFQILA
jgi:tetratricopeptide (TPR) repeat protein